MVSMTPLSPRITRLNFINTPKGSGVIQWLLVIGLVQEPYYER